MATTSKTNSTPSRYAQLTALLEFAQEMGYNGVTDKLTNVAEQWKPKGANSETRKANLAIAKAIHEWMEPGKDYTNEDIRNDFNGLPIGPSGKVQPSKVTAILNVGIVEGLFTVETRGKVRFFTRA